MSYEDPKIIEEDEFRQDVLAKLTANAMYANYLAEGMQELYRRVEKLEEENRNLKTRVIVLEAKDERART